MSSLLDYVKSATAWGVERRISLNLCELKNFTRKETSRLVPAGQSVQTAARSGLKRPLGQSAPVSEESLRYPIQVGRLKLVGAGLELGLRKAMACQVELTCRASRRSKPCFEEQHSLQDPT